MLIKTDVQMLMQHKVVCWWLLHVFPDRVPWYNTWQKQSPNLGREHVNVKRNFTRIHMHNHLHCFPPETNKTNAFCSNGWRTSPPSESRWYSAAPLQVTWGLTKFKLSNGVDIEQLFNCYEPPKEKWAIYRLLQAPFKTVPNITCKIVGCDSEEISLLTVIQAGLDPERISWHNLSPLMSILHFGAMEFRFMRSQLFHLCHVYSDSCWDLFSAINQRT